MNRMMMGFSTLFLLLSTSAFNGFATVKGEASNGGVAFFIEMSTTYHNNGTKNWIFTEEDRTIGLFTNNTWQTIHLINHSHPLEETTLDEDGNPIAILQFPNMELKSGENIGYTVTYYAVSKPRLLPNIEEGDSGTLEEIPEELKESYCRKEGPWLVDDTQLRKLARDIAENETKVLTIVEKFVEWIRQNIDYQVHEVPSYANITYAEGNGDCDDQAILFITLCRIYGIPSYLQIGCLYMPIEENRTYWEGHVTTSLENIVWHGWALAYIPPWGWLPVDLTWWQYNPLNAVKKAAVTMQTTLQYMNICKMDYVASARMEMEFLKNNNFYVYMQDEMMEAPSTNHQNDELERLFPWIAIIVTIVVTVTATGIFMLVSKKLRERKSA